MAGLYAVTHSASEELENYASLVIWGELCGPFQPPSLLFFSLQSQSVCIEQNFSTFQITHNCPTQLHTHSRSLHWSSSSCGLMNCTSLYKVVFTHRISPFSSISASSAVSLLFKLVLTLCLIFYSPIYRTSSNIHLFRMDCSEIYKNNYKTKMCI